MSDTANLKRRNPGKSSEFSTDNEISKDYDNEKSHRSNIHVHRVLPCIPANILLVTFLAGLLFLAYFFHYTLPTPVNESYGPNGEAVFSEKNAREVVRVLSEDIGYRIVGTREEKQSMDYLLELIEEYRQQSRANPNALEFDVDVQIGTGSHRFDMMSKVVMKHYVNVTNIVVRLSCGPECNKNAILLNSHFDSTLSSPGAADDGVGVAVMLEVIRVMSQSQIKRKHGFAPGDLYTSKLRRRYRLTQGPENLQLLYYGKLDE
ncbi:10541_t:CDS:2, partial [Paraglomus occultum]